MDVVWIVLALSTAWSSAETHDLRWNATIWCVDGAAALGVCDPAVGEPTECVHEVVESCLRWTGAGTARDIEADEPCGR